MSRCGGFTTRPRAALLLLSTLGLVLACSAAAEEPGAPNSAGGPGEDANAGNAGAPAHSVPDWCAARLVLQAKCQRCHAEPQENGAPFPLLSYADTQVVDRGGTPRSDRMKAALESDFMPPQFLKLTPEVEPLSDDERTTLLDWLANEPPLDADCD